MKALEAIATLQALVAAHPETQLEVWLEDAFSGLLSDIRLEYGTAEYGGGSGPDGPFIAVVAVENA